MSVRETWQLLRALVITNSPTYLEGVHIKIWPARGTGYRSRRFMDLVSGHSPLLPFTTLRLPLTRLCAKSGISIITVIRPLFTLLLSLIASSMLFIVAPILCCLRFLNMLSSVILLLSVIRFLAIISYLVSHTPRLMTHNISFVLM